MNNFKKIAADAADKYTLINELNFADVVDRQKAKYGGKLPDKYPAAKPTASNLDVGTSKASKVYSGKPQHKDVFGHDTKSQASGATGPRASIMQTAANKIKKVFSKEDVESVEEMSDMQMKKREDTVKSMKKNFGEFRQRYGDKAKSVMYATATKQAMKEDEDQEEQYIEHMCAQHVYHDVFGEGVVLEGEHAIPDENGDIEWYTVEFPHGKETVHTEDVKIMHERMHGHMMKKKKKMMEEEELDEMSSKMKMKLGLYGKKKKMSEEEVYENDGNLANNAPPYDKVTKGDVIMGRLGKDHLGGKSKHAKMKKVMEEDEIEEAMHMPKPDKKPMAPKNSMGGKGMFDRERAKYQAKGVPMGPAEMLAKLKGMK